jgi:hypothetical protein
LLREMQVLRQLQQQVALIARVLGAFLISLT